jgi:hypothetical protein
MVGSGPLLAAAAEAGSRRADRADAARMHEFAAAGRPRQSTRRLRPVWGTLMATGRAGPVTLFELRPKLVR